MKVWNPSVMSAKRAKIGDAIRNPVCAARKATKAKRDEAYRLADRMDAELARRGLRIDQPAVCVGYVERRKR